MSRILLLLVSGALLATGIAAGSSRKLLQETCVAEYAQCGGITCPTDSCPSSSDSQWNCCPSRNSCQRQNEWYWQCLPISGSSTTPSSAQAPSVAAPAAVNPSLIFAATSEGYTPYFGRSASPGEASFDSTGSDSDLSASSYSDANSGSVDSGLPSDSSGRDSYLSSSSQQGYSGDVNSRVPSDSSGMDSFPYSLSSSSRSYNAGSSTPGSYYDSRTNSYSSDRSSDYHDSDSNDNPDGESSGESASEYSSSTHTTVTTFTTTTRTSSESSSDSSTNESNSDGPDEYSKAGAYPDD